MKTLFESRSPEELLLDFLSSKIMKTLFPSHFFHKDRGFAASCKVLSFIRLHNILDHPLSSTLE